MEYKESLEKCGYNFKENQFKFYCRTLDFMKSNKKFLINPAGMGIGKTHPTTFIMYKFLDKYNITFIATPMAYQKPIWIRNLHPMGLLNYTSIWNSKGDVCIFKQLFKDRNFNISKCNDDCDYQRRCKIDKKYTTECREDYEKYMRLGKEISPLKYYENLIKEKKIDLKEYIKNEKNFPFNCLYAPTRMGLKDLYEPGTRKIIVGDYYGFLIPDMFKNVTNLEIAGLNSLLIIDEGWLINRRARDHYSSKIYLNRDLNKLQNEFDKYGEKLEYFNKNKILSFIKKLEKLIFILNKRINGNKLNYVYTNLKEDLDENDNTLLDINKSLKILDEIINDDEDIEGQKSSTSKFAKYITSLKNNSHKPEYYCSLEQKKDLILDCICIDPSKELKKIFKYWNKVIINTGTLPKNKKIVLEEIGINKEDCIYENLLKSYDLSNYIFILPEGKFKSKQRLTTYKEEINKLSEVLNKMSGKTLMFIQSKEDSLSLENLLKQNKFSVINFCRNEDDNKEISSEEFQKITSKFVNYDGKCVGIINIQGRIAGHNFTDDDRIPQVSNVIIYGFPLPSADDLMKAREKLYINKFGNEQEILNHIYLNEVIQKIQQACYRCKRDDKQNPIIILWGERFTQKENFIYPLTNEKRYIIKWKVVKGEYNIFNSLPEYFKNNVGNYDNLNKFIKKREDDRINNTH